MATYCYVRASGVRRLAKENGKKCSADFLRVLDEYIEKTVRRCLNTWNGKRKTLDANLANFIMK